MLEACSSKSVNCTMYSCILSVPCFSLFSLFLANASLIQSENPPLSLILIEYQVWPALTCSCVYLCNGSLDVAEATSLQVLPDKVESLQTSSSQFLNAQGSYYHMLMHH